MNVPRYAETVPFTGRGLMALLWGKSLEAYVSNDPRYGVRIKDDFQDPWTANTSDASLTVGKRWFIQDAAAGGTDENFSQAVNPDGVATLSATTGTDHFGIEAHYGTTATSQGVVNLPSHGTAASRRGRVIYQTRVNLGTQDNYFIGLTEPIVEFLSATGTLPTNSDYIGFYRADDGALKFVMANDNNGGTAVTAEITVLTAAQVTALESAGVNQCNLGFAVNKDLSVEVVVNGKWYAEAAGLSSSALPIESLTMKYAVTRGATGDKSTVALLIDSVDVFIESA